MAKQRCRMVTNKGQRCQRQAQDGGLGFCWQHLPVQASKKNELRRRLKDVGTGALIILASNALEQVVTRATDALIELFGAGDPSQNSAKAQLEQRYEKSLGYPKMRDSYAPGARVDWIGLRAIVMNADSLLASHEPALADIQSLDRKFDTWFNEMNPYHRELLLNSIREFKQSS